MKTIEVLILSIDGKPYSKSNDINLILDDLNGVLKNKEYTQLSIKKVSEENRGVGFYKKYKPKH